MRSSQAYDSPGLPLTLQPYIINARPSTPATGYYPFPAYAAFGSASMSMLGSWHGMQLAPNPAIGSCLAPGQENLPRDLLGWAERQLSRQLFHKQAPDFESAILAFLLVYRDSPLDLHGGSSSSGKKLTPCVNPKDLVRKICEMRCWYMIWHTSKLYAHTPGGAADSQLPPTVIWELRKIATDALIACEKEILLELDELPPDGARLIELPLWACIWQVILIYRQLVSGYCNLARSQPAGSASGGSTGESQPHVIRSGSIGRGDCLLDLADRLPGFHEVSVLTVVKHLYRLLVIKYSAYFGSTSPIFPKKGQPPTAELLRGDEGLRREWDNVLQRRKEFCEYPNSTGPDGAYRRPDDRSTCG